jgi:hypothetical protein
VAAALRMAAVPCTAAASTGKAPRRIDPNRLRHAPLEGWEPEWLATNSTR